MSDRKTTLQAAGIGFAGAVIGAVAAALITANAYRNAPMALFQCDRLEGPVPLEIECRDLSQFSRRIVWVQVETSVQEADAPSRTFRFEAPGAYEISLTAFGDGTGKDDWTAVATAQPRLALETPLRLTIEAAAAPGDSLRERGVAFSETLDVHQTLSETSRSYERSFDAAEGWRIVDARIELQSAAHHSGTTVAPADEGRRAELRFTLRSGPAFDRWRGWLTGTVVLTEERLGGDGGGPLVERLDVAEAGLYPLPGGAPATPAPLRILDAQGRLLGETSEGETLHLAEQGAALRIVRRATGLVLEVERR